MALPMGWLTGRLVCGLHLNSGGLGVQGHLCLPHSASRFRYLSPSSLVCKLGVILPIQLT